jgi:hypothetical protein
LKPEVDLVRAALGRLAGGFRAGSLPPVLASSGASLLVPVDLMSDSNLALIVFIGWMMVASVFVVARHIARRAGCDPSVFRRHCAALSLFVYSTCIRSIRYQRLFFAVYRRDALSAAYEAMLRNARSDSQADMCAMSTCMSTHMAAFAGGSCAARNGSRPARSGGDATRRVWLMAGQYLLACGVWFGIFAGGAASFIIAAFRFTEFLPVAFATAGNSISPAHCKPMTGARRAASWNCAAGLIPFPTDR